MFVPYIPDLIEYANRLGIEGLESHVPDSRLHQFIDDPVTEGIDEG